MPRPPKDFDQFRNEIERCLAQRGTQPKIRNWLTARGVQINDILSERVVA
jgi:hypothetical protein